MGKPIIAVTMGDPAGIGPEIIVKVLASGQAHQACNPVVVGDPGVMASISRVLGADLQFREIRAIAEARFALPTVDVVRPEGLQLEVVPWGQLDPAMGKAAAVCLEKAVEMTLSGEVQGIVSGPLNKEAFHLAGYPQLDDVSFVGDLAGSSGAFIMGVVRSIWTVAVTEHIAFRDILDRIKKDRVLWCVVKMHETLRRVGRADPRIAVAALNVHGGEGGLFGREEIDEIEPAIQAARGQSIDARGPVPADIVFVRAFAGDFDGVVCMYHDQANIARKLQPKNEGATLFMGLPLVCATTAHGTAFDIAGQGIADPGSMQAAIRYAAMLSA